MTAFGKQPHSYGKSPFLMGKLTISMAIFNSYVNVYQRVISCKWLCLNFSGISLSTGLFKSSQFRGFILEIAWGNIHQRTSGLNWNTPDLCHPDCECSKPNTRIPLILPELWTFIAKSPNHTVSLSLSPGSFFFGRIDFSLRLWLSQKDHPLAINRG